MCLVHLSTMKAEKIGTVSKIFLLPLGTLGGFLLHGFKNSFIQSIF